ncbi:MAG TPA: class I SAM-dependent methyltransferase [Methanotrichaceae archaeon]|nr:class I SAM-dependent methyltransferase [Methanotrichaceae archaeon]
MLLNRLLGLGEEENVFLAEESLEDLINLPVTSEILEEGLEHEGCIEIDGRSIAVRLTEPAEFWLVLTDRYAKRKILEEHWGHQLREGCKKVSATESEFFTALTEYYANSLAGELLCESCNVKGSLLYVEERIGRLEDFLKPLIPKDRSILEICCGNGMATQALLRLGHAPVSMDSDRCDLCQALKGGLLDPRRSFVLDARLLDSFFEPQSFDAVVGFMVGLIDMSNWPVWRDIILRSSRLARDLILLTVYTEKEARLIAKALGEVGWKGEVIDNRDSRGIYDQWAYLATKDS